MKKRLFALMLAGIMLHGSAGCVSAKETETVSEAAEEVLEVTMDMLKEAAYKGTWLSFTGGFDLYLPSEWDVLEISEEDAEEGLMFHAVSLDESGLSVVVMGTEIGTEFTLEMVKAELEEKGFTETVYRIFNDIPTVMFETETTAGVAFLDDEGMMYNVQVGPSADEAFEAVADNIFYSLSLTEEAEKEDMAE